MLSDLLGATRGYVRNILFGSSKRDHNCCLSMKLTWNTPTALDSNKKER